MCRFLYTRKTILFIFCNLLFTVCFAQGQYGLYYGDKPLSFVGTENQCKSEIDRLCHNERDRQLNGKNDNVSIKLTDAYMANYRAGFRIVQKRISAQPSSGRTAVGGVGRQNNHYPSSTTSYSQPVNSGGSGTSVGTIVSNSLADALTDVAFNGLINLLFGNNNRKDNSTTTDFETMDKKNQLEEESRKKQFEEEANIVRSNLRGFSTSNNDLAIRSINDGSVELNTNYKNSELTVRNEPLIFAPNKDVSLFIKNNNNIWSDENGRQGDGFIPTDNILIEIAKDKITSILPFYDVYSQTKKEVTIVAAAFAGDNRPYIKAVKSEAIRLSDHTLSEANKNIPSVYIGGAYQIAKTAQYYTGLKGRITNSATKMVGRIKDLSYATLLDIFCNSSRVKEEDGKLFIDETKKETLQYVYDESNEYLSY